MEENTVKPQKVKSKFKYALHHNNFNYKMPYQIVHYYKAEEYNYYTINQQGWWYLFGIYPMRQNKFSPIRFSRYIGGGVTSSHVLKFDTIQEAKEFIETVTTVKTTPAVKHVVYDSEVGCKEDFEKPGGLD